LKYFNSLAKINAYKYLKTFKGRDEEKEGKGIKGGKLN
jgi:hypothetical protein